MYFSLCNYLKFHPGLYCWLYRYDLIVTLCWQLLPEKRLTFKQLVQQLQEYWDEEHAYVVEDIAI